MKRLNVAIQHEVGQDDKPIDNHDSPLPMNIYKIDETPNEYGGGKYEESEAAFIVEE